MKSLRSLIPEILVQVLDRGIPPRLAVERAAGSLDSRDRALLVEVVHGVIRYKITLDEIIDGFLKKPGSLVPFTRNNLRAGAYQLLHMRVPAFAAVNESVSAERTHKSLVNAVLRNIERSRSDIDARLSELDRVVQDEEASQSRRVRALSVRYSFPRWLVRRWVQRLGMQEARLLLRAMNTPPELTLRVNTLRATREDVLEELRAQGIEADATRYSPVGIRVRSTGSFERVSFLRDCVMVQDEAAQLVSLMLEPRAGDRVLDVCAAPGGKTAHIAELMAGQGEVLAIDVDETRLLTLRENMVTMGHEIVEARLGNILDEEFLRSLGQFNRILVDAPCSALGTVRKNPDIKYRYVEVAPEVDPAEVAAKEIQDESSLIAQSRRQGEILLAASRLLTPGGRLVYAVCSTEPEEGEDVIAAFLKSSPEFFIIECTRIPYGGDLPASQTSRELALQGGTLRTWPHQGDDGMDGFFCAALERKQ